MLVLAPVLVLGAACSSDDNQPGRDQSTVVTIPSSSPSSSAPTPSSPAAAGTACDEVVAGIDAFNGGDFEGTVEHFKAAVPLAEAESKADPGPAADDLLEAVRYYADLAPADYTAASLSSPDFAKYKAITLGQCASDGPAPSDGGGVFA